MWTQFTPTHTPIAICDDTERLTILLHNMRNALTAVLNDFAVHLGTPNSAPIQSTKSYIPRSWNVVVVLSNKCMHVAVLGIYRMISSRTDSGVNILRSTKLVVWTHQRLVHDGNGNVDRPYVS